MDRPPNTPRVQPVACVRFIQNRTPQMKHLKRLLPDFPRTPHLPHRPVLADGDLVIEAAEAAILFSPPEGTRISLQEKVDGANMGAALVEGHPVIRNRTKILTKGYFKDTQAKRQFLPAWNWFYANKDKFEALEAEYPGVTVYGEWMLYAHGMRYDQLPDLFIAYDLYDQEAKEFISPYLSMPLLKQAGFSTAPEVHEGPLNSWAQLDALCAELSRFSSTERREGLVIKVSGPKYIVAHFKIVREGFKQGQLWEEGIKNVVASPK